MKMANLKILLQKLHNFCKNHNFKHDITKIFVMSFIVLSFFNFTNINKINNNIKYQILADEILFDISKFNQYLHKIIILVDNYNNFNSNHIKEKIKILSFYENTNNNFNKNFCSFKIISNFLNKNYYYKKNIKKGNSIINKLLKEYDFDKNINYFIDENDILTNFYILEIFFNKDIDIFSDILENIYNINKNILQEWSPSYPNNLRKYYDKNKIKFITKFKNELIKINKDNFPCKQKYINILY